MSVRLIAGLAAFSIAVTGAFLGAIIFTMMIGEINRQRKDAAPISYWGFHYFKLVEVYREYRSAFPAGRLHLYYAATVAVALVGMLGVAVSLGFFRGWPVR